MTLDELRAMKEKFAEVQNTIKRDIEYINKGVATEEQRVVGDWDDFIGSVQKLFEFLPNADDLYKRSRSTIVEKSFYSCEYPKLSVWVSTEFKTKARYFDIRYYEHTNNPHIVRVYEDKACGMDNTYTPRELEDGWKKNVALVFMPYKDKLYAMAEEAVVKSNKEINNWLIEQNKKALDRVAELKEM